MFDFASMEQAVLVLEQGSFRKAASVMHVRPSVISRRVRSLEDLLGVSLFQRQSGGAQPTPAGIRILQRTRKILDDLELLARTARLSGEGTEGSLCIGVVSSIAGGILRHLLVSFLSANPNIDLLVAEGSPRNHIPAVAALRMDAVFVVGTPTAPGCELEPLWTERIMVAVSSDNRLSTMEVLNWDDLAGERFIVSKMDPGPEIQDFVIKHLATLGHHPDIEPRPVNRETLLALVGLKLGISLVGEAEAAVRYPGVVYRPLRDGILPFHVGWSTKNDNPVLRRFLSRSRIEAKRLLAEPDPVGGASETPGRSP